LPGDELHLTDGRIIEGEIISGADADVVDIRVGTAGLVAIQHFPRSKVLRVVHRVSARQTAMNELQQQADVLAGRTDATAAEWWALARKLQERGEQATARDLATRVIALDRHHEEARRLLGMVRHQGVWMRPNEIATARGEVYFRGSWVTWAQQEEALAEEARRREEQAVQRKEREEQRRQARIAAAVAAENAAAMQETYVSGYYRSPYYNPYGGSFYRGAYSNGYYTGGYYGGLGYQFGGHSPGYRPGHPLPPGAWCPPRSGWHIGASGAGSSHAWSFRWNP
jgi:hypothetical protein